MQSIPKTSMPNSRRFGELNTADYLKAIGVRTLPALTSPFDPGYDPATLESHLEQSGRLMSILKISMACWLVADEGCSRQKIDAARRHILGRDISDVSNVPLGSFNAPKVPLVTSAMS